MIKERTTKHRVDMAAQMTLLVFGLAAVALSRLLKDRDSTAESLLYGGLIGAGIALLLASAFVTGVRMRRPKVENDATLWLPSRDGARDEK